MRVLVRLFLPSTKPLERRVGRKSKKARIFRRQVRKADKALRSSLGPSRLTVAIQASKSASSVVEEAVAYQVRKASFFGNELATTSRGPFPGMMGRRTRGARQGSSRLGKSWRKGNRFGRRGKKAQEPKQQSSKLGLQTRRSHLLTFGAHLSVLLQACVLPGFI